MATEELDPSQYASRQRMNGSQPQAPQQSLKQELKILLAPFTIVQCVVIVVCLIPLVMTPPITTSQSTRRIVFIICLILLLCWTVYSTVPIVPRMRGDITQSETWKKLSQIIHFVLGVMIFICLIWHLLSPNSKATMMYAVLTLALWCLLSFTVIRIIAFAGKLVWDHFN